MDEFRSPPLLLVASRSLNLAGRSGYPLLGEYLPHSTQISVPRRDPRVFTSRLLNRAIRTLAFTDWYRLESASMEMDVLRFLRRNPECIIHMMWADSDLGFLDLLRPSFPFRLCGTFHHCDDTIAGALHYPGRLNRLDAVILMSESQAPFFLNHGVSRDRVHVVLHGVDTQFFRPSGTPPVEASFRVLSVGGYRRNFAQLRQLCIMLAEQTGIVATIIGPRQELTEFSEIKGIRLLSGISDNELLGEYQSASCFLMTAENATANNAILEAMATGLPIVAERVGGIPEYVNNDCAMLVERGDLEGCVRAIRAIRDSRSQQQSMALAARARAEELDWTKVASRMMDIYMDVARS